MVESVGVIPSRKPWDPSIGGTMQQHEGLRLTTATFAKTGSKWYELAKVGSPMLLKLLAILLTILQKELAFLFVVKPLHPLNEVLLSLEFHYGLQAAWTPLDGWRDRGSCCTHALLRRLWLLWLRFGND